MFDFRDLFQWDRFITPSIVKTFYLLAVVIAGLVGLSELFSAFAMMAVSPLGGIIMILAVLVGTLVAVIAIRIAAEFVLITFRINEHLGALRHNAGR
jgi:Domain of unknown function (DUF4282)